MNVRHVVDKNTVDVRRLEQAEGRHFQVYFPG